jgi:pimeloyl-ACP methyl ester carboxylesterase
MKVTVIAPFVLLVGFAAGLAATIGCQSRAPASTPSHSAASPGLPDDGMVDVGGGVSLHVHCDGEGSPMVLLEACLSCQVMSGGYRPIWSEIGRFTRACRYDRAGAGYSSPAPKPHLARQIVGELRKLLGERDGSGAIVLVGHGLGGLVAQLYARDFPRSVAGMVLVDPLTKDYDSRYLAMYPPSALVAARADLDQSGLVASPENVDADDVFGVMADLRRAPLSLGDRPLVVVTRGKPPSPKFGIPAEAWGKLEATRRTMVAEVASLSKNSAHVVAAQAASIPYEAPDRVVTAAWQVVSSVRSGVPLSRLSAKAPPAASSSAAARTATKAAVVQPLRPPPFADDRMVDIGGGMSLHLHCVGHGTPTVLMENGAGADGTSWSTVLNEFGRITRACAYDRVGEGFSSGPQPEHHSFRQATHELHVLLERAAIPGPYVLVGHSVGGITVRLFQAEHPNEVVGMVLVDGETETSLQGLMEILSSPGSSDERRAMTRDLGPWLEDFRTSVRPLGDMPLVVLTARGNEPNPPLFEPEQEAAQRQKVIAGHEMVARLSTNSAHAIADHSGHFMQVDARRLVVASVKQVVEAARTHGRVDAKALAPFLHDGPYPPRD